MNHKVSGYTDEIMKATGGRGVDLIVEMAAHVNLDRDLGLLAKHGRVVVVGNRGKTEIDARQAMGRDAAILGMTLFNVTEAEFVEIHAALDRRPVQRHAESGDRQGDPARRRAARARSGDGAGRARQDRSHDMMQKIATAMLAHRSVSHDRRAGGRRARAASRRQPRGKAVYDAHCVECHGAAGKGDGPSAAYLAPRPRDFTTGKYKIRSTESGTCRATTI